jgi:thymidylate synthase ThyX
MKTLADLNHHTTRLSGGGKIVILDPGAVLTPEATSMLQALHSRSVGGIDEHLKVLAEKGPDKFMSTYYVGYGHKSIGDCGMATVFIEGVSMLAAKAIQDSPLYNGQEASTRYIDFASQPFIDPLGSGGVVQEAWRKFYLKAVEIMKAELPNRYPRGGEEKESTYTKAIAARAFDICRGFLPAGASTNLAWTTTLRQFADRVLQLRHHPLPEVREIAEKLEDALIATYPSSFDNEKKRYNATEAYLTQAATHYYYHDPGASGVVLTRDAVDRAALAPYRSLLTNRPAKTELPKWLGAYGTATFSFALDYGSFRDLQRHRAVIQRMPLLTSDIGFHPWYLDELTPTLHAEAETLITTLTNQANTLTADTALRQYYLPMGLQVSNYLSGDLPSLVYLVELRATSLVHPTLSTRASEMATLLATTYADLGLTLHLDPDPGRFNIKRGEHDIVKTTGNSLGRS